MNNNDNLPEENFNFSLDLDDITKIVSDNVEQSNDIVDENGSIEIDPAYIIPEPSDNTIPSNPISDKQTDNIPVEESAYTTALSLLKESGMFEIPDNIESVDDEIWSEIVNYNKERYKAQLLEEIKLNAGDTRIAELYDYVRTGGTWHGVENMVNTIQDEINVENLDPTDEQHQRYLIETYLTEGLDPNIPINAKRIANIQEEVNTYIDRLEAEALAQEAKEYYLQKINIQKENLRIEQEEYQRQEAIRQQEEIQRQQEWAHTFQLTLNERPWSDTKKKEVINQFSQVELDNGQTMEMWRYKLDAIWQNPKSTQIFLDFMSDFDPYKLEFNRNGVPTNKQVSSTIENIIHAKQQQKSKSAFQDQQRQTQQIKQIDPRNL